MIRPVMLYGELRARFGPRFDFDVASPHDAIQALVHLVPGFMAYLREHKDSAFQVLVGERSLDEAGLMEPLGRNESIKLVPVVAGAEGVGQILLGAALIYLTAGTASILAGWGASAGLVTAVSGMGWAMALGGVAQLIAGAPPENYGIGGGNKDAETWSFGAPTVTTGQGGCVPLGYGEMEIGGHLISAGIDAQTWQDKGFGGTAPDNAGTRGGDGDASPWTWAIAP